MCLTNCQKKAADGYPERLGIKEKSRFINYVIVLDHGCHSCKNPFYEYVIRNWRESNALVFKRMPETDTFTAFPELFDKDFLFIDSVDISFELGLTGRNTEIALIKQGKVKHYSFLEYEELIRELED